MIELRLRCGQARIRAERCVAWIYNHRAQHDRLSWDHPPVKQGFLNRQVREAEW